MEEDAAASADYRDVAYTARDGLKLAARDYGPRSAPWTPVVCLAGLTRTSRDFHGLAMHLANDPDRPRRVVAFDYRGRGRSAWDKNASNYTPVTEMNDVFDGMAALGVSRAVVVGTSRGGIIGMLMGVTRPASVAGLVLNDVGPELEAQGLARIKAYVGRTPVPDDWADAARIQKRLHGANFPAFEGADWDAFARLTYRDEDGHPVSDHDPALAVTLEGVDLEQPLTAMWDAFAALKALPILVIRGEHTDLLGAATVQKMKALHPNLTAVTAIGQGHPPILEGDAILDRVAGFIRELEGREPPADAGLPFAAAGDPIR